MTKRREIASAPEPLEAYTSQFDHLFGKSNQREAFRWYLEGLLLPSERNKTLTGLVSTVCGTHYRPTLGIAAVPSPCRDRSLFR